jgi:hypothetical protein
MPITRGAIFFSVWSFAVHGAAPQASLPEGAVSLVNEDRFGSRVALCAETGEPPVQQGAKVIRGTGIWVGEPGGLRRLSAGAGACDPAWSPDGRRLTVVSSEGLWVFAATDTKGALLVEARLPVGMSSEFAFRSFSRPEWSPDGALIAILVTNGGTSWVEVFEAATGRLFYTSPPEQYSFRWNSARELKLDSLEIKLPSR